MPPITSFFRPPPWSRAHKGPAPEQPPKQQPLRPPEPISSPLSDPPPSTWVDLTSDAENESDPNPNSNFQNKNMSPSVAERSSPSPLSASSSSPVPAPAPAPAAPGTPVPVPATAPAAAPAPGQSFQNIGSAPMFSSFGSSTASQRIVKDGKEVVISSDGEDTDSIASLEDPDVLFAPKNKKPKKDEAAETKKPTGIDKALIAQLSKPKKYKNSIDSLVNDAADDRKMEENVARVKAAFAHELSNEQAALGQKRANKNALREETLTYALGDNEDGADFKRLLDAVRRTEALDQDQVWHFLDQTQMMPATPEFPTYLFAPGSHLAVLREPETRNRAFQSGILEFAASLQRLPDVFIHWLFCSIPLEPRDELRKAYCRVFTAARGQIKSLIRPNDVDCLFQQLGAKPEALDLTKVLRPEPPERTSQSRRLRDRTIMISIFNLLRDAADLFADDTRERAIHSLLRMTIDTFLMAHSDIRSELQSALSALLERVPEASIEEMDRRICATVFETVKEIQFQSRMLQHILPTSMWISLLRYRLAMAFLLQDPRPLTEPPEKVLDLKRLTVSLTRDERFNMKLQKAKDDYDYNDLSAACVLLEVVVNSGLYDLGYKQADTAKEFDAVIDQLAGQIKNIFSSIADTGASHLKRMLAKEALEALHYRVIYSVRSRPPPKKTLFQSYARDNGNIMAFFQRVDKDPGEEGTSASLDALDNSAMPIRGH